MLMPASVNRKIDSVASVGNVQHHPEALIVDAESLIIMSMASLSGRPIESALLVELGIRSDGYRISAGG